MHWLDMTYDINKRIGCDLLMMMWLDQMLGLQMSDQSPLIITRGLSDIHQTTHKVLT